MNINLYAVESPLQLMSAIEAAHHDWGDDGSVQCRNVLVIRFGHAGRARNNEQLQQLLKLFKWDEVIDISTPATARVVRELVLMRRNVIRLGRRLSGTVEHMFIGDFRTHWMHYLRHALRPRETYLLDDGAVTIQIQKQYLAQGVFFPNVSRDRFLLKALKRFIYAGMLKRKFLAQPIHVFSSFNLPQIEQQKQINHSYKMLSEIVGVNAAERASEVWFFGSKYSEAGVLTRSDEFENLAGVMEYFRENFPELSFKYVPHRDESSDKLRDFEDRLGLNLLRIDLPAEMYFLMSDIRPQVVAGYYTTTLLNLKVLFAEFQMISFRLPGEQIKPNFRGAVLNVYDFFESQDIFPVDHATQKNNP